MTLAAMGPDRGRSNGRETQVWRSPRPADRSSPPRRDDRLWRWSPARPAAAPFHERSPQGAGRRTPSTASMSAAGLNRDAHAGIEGLAEAVCVGKADDHGGVSKTGLRGCCHEDSVGNERRRQSKHPGDTRRAKRLGGDRAISSRAVSRARAGIDRRNTESGCVRMGLPRTRGGKNQHGSSGSQIPHRAQEGRGTN